MDLQIRRNLEHFFQLSGIVPRGIESQMVFLKLPFTLLLEVRKDRLMLTSGYRDSEVDKMLPILLRRCYPERFFGVVQRPFLLRGEALINCAPPLMSQSDLWFNLYNMQRRALLSAASEVLQ